MKKIFLFSLLLSLSSCSVIKNIKKNKEKESEKSELKSDVKSETAVTTIDLSKSKVVTNETLDTLITLGGFLKTWDIATDKITTIPVQVGDSSESVTLAINPKTGKIDVTLKTAPKSIPIKFNKRTEKEQDNNIVSTSNKKEDRKEDLKKESKSKTQTTDRDVKKFSVLPWWLWLILILAAVVYVAYRAFKIYRKANPLL